MKKLLRYVLVVFLSGLSPVYFAFNETVLKGDSVKHSSYFPSSLHTPDTTTLRQKALNRDEVYYLVDSLLDLDSISINDIQLVKYYSDLLNAEKHSWSAIPASEFYDEFDEQSVFTITPENAFPENQMLVIQSDSLGKYVHPHQGIITSKYGWRDGKMHKGTDIDLKKGQAIVAAFDGMVRVARKQGAYGNVVIIRHYNGLETVYAHLSKIKVKPGQVIAAGQILGLGGSTGRSSGPHLHFEVRFKGQALNSSNFISYAEGKMECDTLTIKRSRWGITAYPSQATLYTIQRGDSWFEIAKRYGLSMKQLCTLNGVERRYYLKVGQKLRIN
jgi:murein DD-endopeptidase MepM/ murein hydrolase activator NlpD